EVRAVVDQCHPGKVALHRRRALVLGPVVDDDDVGVRIVVAGEALEAGHQLVHPVPGEDQDDDVGQGGRGILGHVRLSLCDRPPIATAVNSAPRSAGPSPAVPTTRNVLAWLTQSWATPSRALPATMVIVYRPAPSAAVKCMATSRSSPAAKSSMSKPSWCEL